jgi:hypothetical protein
MKTQRYLVTADNIEPFYTNWYDYENHYNDEMNMIVYDIHNHLYTLNGLDWIPLEKDNL